jgi:putative heme-binding domain-containing protein
LAGNDKNSRATRLEALAALPAGLNQPSAAIFDFLMENIQPTRQVLERSLAATVLGKAQLTTEQLVALSGAMRTAGALELNALLAAFEKSHDEAVGSKLASALEEAVHGARLRPDLVRTRLAQYGGAVQERGEVLARRLRGRVNGDEVRLHKLEATPTNGDSRRGQAIFNSSKAACSTCHAVGYVGGRVGPDLTKVGPTRTERDLLESILFPSASFVRSYEPFVVTTKDGEEHTGMLWNESEASVLLVSAPGAEQRIDRTEIVEMRPGTVSVMPEGLDEQLNPQELADLVAFLKSLR